MIPTVLVIQSSLVSCLIPMAFYSTVKCSQMQSNAVSVEMFLSFLPFDSCSPANQVFHHLTRRVIPAEET